ncbi:beta-lactamase-like protein [Pisolithus marmoratus]|nr:beta-lactamase-like protein [Pisolithus marmoratus]
MAQNPEVLQSITRLSKHVVRILGQNPGKYTLQGTNTYLIGEGRPYTLVDTGEGKPEYIPLLESVLLEDDVGGISDNGQGKRHISDIIISHWHLDHVGGVPSVLDLLRRLWDAQNPHLPFKPPRLHKFPHTLPSDDWSALVKKAILPGSYDPGVAGSLFHDLKDGQSFPITTLSPSPEGPPQLRVVHSPGHTEDSICLLSSGDKVLYTADTVLGQSSTVFENLGTYMTTLRSLLSLREEYDVLYPGHGPVVQDGAQSIEAYINHRMEREEQILRVMEQPPPEGKDSWTTWDIVSIIYAAYPRELWMSAAMSVNQHLEKLVNDGKVRKLGGEGKDTQWELLVKSFRSVF